MSYIEKIAAKDFGLFENVNVKFNKGINVIIGGNASGKSTILKIIASSFSYDFSRIRLTSKTEFYTKFISKNKTFSIGIGKGSFKHAEPSYRNTQLIAWNHPSVPQIPHMPPLTPFEPKNVVMTYSEFNGNKEFDICPLFIGPNRSLNYIKIEGMKREETREQQINKYRQSSLKFLESTEVPHVKQWMINRYYQIDKTWASDFASNWNFVVNSLPTIAPKYSEFSFKEIREDLEPRFMLNGDEVFLEELSSGFKSVLSIIFTVVDWVESVFEGPDRKIENARGTVLIDELDVHLHPEWQLTILNTLRKLFPNLQFIVTTHSPHIVSSCKENELIIIPQHSGTLNIKPQSNLYSGWEVTSLLEKVMNVSNVENEEFSALMRRVQKAANDCDEETYSQLTEVLKKMLPEGDSIFQILDLQISAARKFKP